MCTCMYMSEAKRGYIRFLRIEVIGSCVAQNKNYTFLTTEPYLQPECYFYCLFFFETGSVQASLEFTRYLRMTFNS